MLVTPKNTYYLESEVFNKDLEALFSVTDGPSSISPAPANHSVEEFLNKLLLMKDGRNIVKLYLFFSEWCISYEVNLEEVLQELGAERVDNGKISSIQIFLFKKGQRGVSKDMYCLLGERTDYTEESYYFYIESIFGSIEEVIKYIIK